MNRVPKRVQDWDGCPHVKTCTHCGGHGSLYGILGREKCPACQGRGVRWAGTIYPAMEKAGYGVQAGECCFVAKDSTGRGHVLAEVSVIANLLLFGKVA